MSNPRADLGEKLFFVSGWDLSQMQNSRPEYIQCHLCQPSKTKPKHICTYIYTSLAICQPAVYQSSKMCQSLKQFLGSEKAGSTDIKLSNYDLETVIRMSNSVGGVYAPPSAEGVE